MLETSHIRRLAGVALAAFALLLVGTLTNAQLRLTGSDQAIAAVASVDATQVAKTADDEPCSKFASPQSRKQGCKRGGVASAGSPRLRDDDQPTELDSATGHTVLFPASRFGSTAHARAHVIGVGNRARSAPFWDAFSRTSSLLY